MIILATIAGLAVLPLTAGVLYTRVMHTILVGAKPGTRSIREEMLWAQYLQALFLSQWFTLGMVNGSWLCALLHRLCGAKTSLDTTWLSFNVRDHPMLTAESGAVIDRCGYFVGHKHDVNRKDDNLGFQGRVSSEEENFFQMCPSTLGKEACIHPYAIILAGQSIRQNGSLDANSHSHMEGTIPRYEHWGGIPARKLEHSRLFQLKDSNSCHDV